MVSSYYIGRAAATAERNLSAINTDKKKKKIGTTITKLKPLQKENQI